MNVEEMVEVVVVGAGLRDFSNLDTCYMCTRKDSLFTLVKVLERVTKKKKWKKSKTRYHTSYTVKTSFISIYFSQILNSF